MLKSLVKQLAIRLGYQKTIAKSLVIVELLGFAIALTLSSTVFAVGMGGINVGSGLGQPLKADIELMAVSKAEKSSLIARIASPDAYKDAGLEYPYGNKFRFQIESRANGEPYLSVSSEHPITDPFVIMLVELTWSSGKLLREYTFLLDPPGYVPEQPAQAVVQAVAPVIQSVPSAPAETPVTPKVQTAPLSQPAQVISATPTVPTAPTEDAAPSVPVTQPAPVAKPAPVAQPVPAGMEELPELDEWIAIKRGDTMREVADRYKQADMSLDRMLVALYRVNANTFDGKNMNRIRAGKILRLPHQAEVEAVSQRDAIREIRAQAADWNVYRQKLARASVIKTPPQEVQQIATGKISSSVADMAPPVKESAREVLKLSRGEAPGDSTATGAGGKIESAQDKKNAAQEDAIAKGKALEEDQARIAMLEKQIKDMQRLAELKAGLPGVKPEAAASDQPSKTPASPAVAVSGLPPPPASIEKPKPLPKPKVVEPESIMDQAMAMLDQVIVMLEEVLGEQLYLAGGALLLLVFGGLGFVYARRKGFDSFRLKGFESIRLKVSELFKRKKKQHSDGVGSASEDADSSPDATPTSGRIAAPVVSSPDTGDFTNMGGSAEAAHHHDDTVDPIGEADLFLNFGRDVQAEEILTEALQSTPNDHRIHLKLLGIYANRVDVNSFSKIARQLQDSGDADAWQKAFEMGRKLEPNNPLYGGSGNLEDTGSATAQTAAEFDVTQMFGSGNAPAAQASELDFDIDLGSSSGNDVLSPEQNFLGDTDQNAIMSFDVLSAEQTPVMDFNITEEHGGDGQEENALPDIGGLTFDVEKSNTPSQEDQTKVAKPAESDDGGMEFTIDFPAENMTKQAAPEVQTADTGLAGISFNFDEEFGSGESIPGGKDEHWQDIATKLDLAKAYQEMGDASGAREILDEVMRDGDEGQREAAQTLLNQLG